jgi:hypothetical protein
VRTQSVVAEVPWRPHRPVVAVPVTGAVTVVLNRPGFCTASF